MCGEEKPTCPRCGLTGGYTETRHVKDHIYYYWVHRFKEGKKVRIKKCYLGSLKYTYVERFNPLDLAGLTDKERFFRYAQKLLENLNMEQLRWLREAVDRMLKLG